MERLPPISTPLERRWREFRIQYLPMIAFGLSVLAAVVLWGEFAVPQHLEAPVSDSVETSLQPSIQSVKGNLATVSLGSALTNSTPSEYSD